MIIAFQRWLAPPHSVNMVMDIDGSWDFLKLEMCRAWDIEREFDENDVWTLLRQGDTVLVGGALYCLFDQHRDDASGANVFGLFEPTRGKLCVIDAGLPEGSDD